VIHLPSLVDFDYYFLFVGWWQYAAAAASALASVYGAKKINLLQFMGNYVVLFPGVLTLGISLSPSVPALL
jgi:hypothetical protein